MEAYRKQILKRPDGSRVSIAVNISVNYNSTEASYHEEVRVCGKSKRTWAPSFDRDNYEYRRLSMEDREAYVKVANRKLATPEEILAVKMELWKSLEPKL